MSHKIQKNATSRKLILKIKFYKENDKSSK